MKKTKFTEAQIIGILKEQERGLKVSDICRKHGIGELFIRNCTFVPAGGRPISASLIGGSNSGKHDFGYTCYMPERITIEELHIDDSKHPVEYHGPAIFANFNPHMTDDSYLGKFPYVRTREIILRNVTIASGKALRLSDNTFMFKDVKVNTDQRVLHAKP